MNQLVHMTIFNFFKPTTCYITNYNTIILGLLY